MKTIEMIVKEMNELIEANGLDWWDVRNTLNNAKRFFENRCNECVLPSNFPTNISGVRENYEMGHYITARAAFINFILDKNEVRELIESMDNDNTFAFIFDMWELMLHIGFVDNKYDEKVRKNLETLFNDNEDVIKSFNHVLVEIKSKSI